MVNRVSFRVGERVLVAWGLDEIEGLVVGYYGEGRAERIRVQLGAADSEDEKAPVVSLLPSAVRILA